MTNSTSTQDLIAKLGEAITRVTEMADVWEDDARLEDLVRAGLQSELDKFNETPRRPDVNLRLVRAAVDAKNNARRFREDASHLRALLTALSTTPHIEGEKQT